jgi:hypothetical protein
MFAYLYCVGACRLRLLLFNAYIIIIYFSTPFEGSGTAVDHDMFRATPGWRLFVTILQSGWHLRGCCPDLIWGNPVTGDIGNQTVFSVKNSVFPPWFLYNRTMHDLRLEGRRRARDARAWWNNLEVVRWTGLY